MSAHIQVNPVQTCCPENRTGKRGKVERGAKEGGSDREGFGVSLRLGEYLTHKCITKQAGAQKCTDECMLFGTLNQKLLDVISAPRHGCLFNTDCKNC